MNEDPAAGLMTALHDRSARPFMRTPDGSVLTYSGLDELSGRHAAALAALGIGAGDRVAARTDKSIASVVLYVACLRLGCVYVPIDVAYTMAEVDHLLRDANPRLAIVRPMDEEKLAPHAQRAGVERTETLGAGGEGSLTALAARSRSPHPPMRPFAADAPAAILYTSGTTGRAKGAVLTRGNLGSNAATLARAWRFSADDVLLHTLPLFHVHGLFVAINTVLASAASVLLMPAFDAAAVLEWLPQATVYMGVPTHYTRLLQQPGLGRDVAAGMRLFISGSAPLLAETHEMFYRRSGHRILERYGMTECLMITSNPYDGPRIPGTVGPALPGVSVRLTGAIGEEADEGIGHIEVAGPNVFAGYWRDARRSHAEFTDDGWFKTGDIGRIDDKGVVTIVGRAKDLVITGGYNVYPKEVEDALNALPGIMESAVFGVPHPDFGEAVTAAVVTVAVGAGVTVAEAGVLQALKTRLAAYKIPKRILFVPELPRNVMGKIQKNSLRIAHAKLYL
ncbi:MAG: malonyl-CoA synthase [Steroidobacteraceae bacterium]